MKEHITPEVGDIWELKSLEVIVRIIYVDGIDVEFCYYIPCIDFIKKDKTDYKTFKKLYKYLGKSKANINDLFKTENEE